MALIDSLQRKHSMSDGESSCAESRSTTSGVERSSGTGNSTNSNRTGETTDDDLNTIKNSLAKQETTQVFRLRVAVVLILIAAATAISLSVYFITKNSEEEEFVAQYEGVANKILGHFEQIMVEMSAVSGLAVAATTHLEQVKTLYEDLPENYTIDFPVDWPYVTMPSFQERAGNVRSLSGAIYVSINPVIDKSELPVWESYVQSDANMWM